MDEQGDLPPMERALLTRVEELLELLDETPDHAKLRRLADDMRAFADRLRSGSTVNGDT